MLDFPRYSEYDKYTIPVMYDRIEQYILDFYEATTSIGRINAILHICYAAIQHKSIIETTHSKAFVLEMIKCILRNEDWISTYMPVFEIYMLKELQDYKFIEGKDDTAIYFKGIYIELWEVEEVYTKNNLAV
jgi:hypothetical protein